MPKVLTCNRVIKVTKEMGSHVVSKLLDQVEQQIKDAIKEEARYAYAMPVPTEKIAIVHTVEHDPISEEDTYTVTGKLEAADFSDMCEEVLRTRYPIKECSPILPDERLTRTEPSSKKNGLAAGAKWWTTRTNLKILHALLEETCPHWKEIYDRLKRTEALDDALNDPFTDVPKYRVHRDLAGKPFGITLDDLTGKGSDSATKK